MDGGRQLRRLRRVGPAAARLVVLAAALVGLFAMHGLSDHGVAGHSGMDQPHIAMTQTASSHVATTPDGPSVLEQVSASADDMSMGAMGLCLAVLGLGLLTLLIRRQWRPFADLALRLTRPRLLVTVRAPDPPDLIRLSVQRC